jgi:hypothetical protein
MRLKGSHGKRWTTTIDIVARLRRSPIQELFAVQVLPGIHYPELLNDGRHPLVADAVVLPAVPSGPG